MNYLQVEQLSISVGDKTLFSGIDFVIDQGQKVALLARNGAGKSTMLNIIAGFLQPDEGKVTFRKNIRVSYLEQNPDFAPEKTIGESIFMSDSKIMKTVRVYEEFMQKNPNMNIEKNRQKYQQLVEKMDSCNAWNYESKIKQIITRLRIDNFNKPAKELSGGQKKRVALAKILIDDPELLILDEPTNHLDVDIIEWLESYLSKSGKTLLLVTHDRYFIDKLCDVIFELDNKQLYTYRGNYSYFLKKKQERVSAETARSEKAKNLLNKETEWMRRQPKARTTKSKSRIAQFHNLTEMAQSKATDEQIEISMNMSRMGKKVLEVSQVSKKFNGKEVIKDFSYTFKKRDRVGIIGPNGSGKTTLLNIITGKIKPDSGSVTKGETITFGHYKQEGIDKPEDDKKVIDIINQISENITIDKKKSLSASQFLHYFNFSYRAQHDYVNKLSGGEKRRLYLMTVLMKRPNFLIMDEPTNDLDIETLNVIEDFLEHFQGCLIIVSHDRFFLDKLVDHLFVFDSKSGFIKNFPGNYTDYTLSLFKQKKDFKSCNQTKSETKTKTKNEKASKKPKTKLTYKENKEFEALNKEIEELEKHKEKLLQKMNSGELTGKDLLDLSEEYQKLEEEIEQKTERWIELSDYL